MQASNRVLRALRDDKTSYGAWQMLPGTNLTRVMCRSHSAVDWLLVDLEHGNLSDDSMHEIVAAAAACGVSPIVRVAEGQSWMIKRALDSGAHGLLVPLINTADDALRVVQAAKFPPVGKRGFESLLAVEKFVQNGKQLKGIEYLQQANDSLIIAVQIETKEALKNVEAIAAVPGVDVLFIGPFDLSVDMGCPFTDIQQPDPELINAISTINRAAQQAGILSGIYCDSGEQAKRYAEMGFRMINVMTDMVGLRQVFSQAFQLAV